MDAGDHVGPVDVRHLEARPDAVAVDESHRRPRRKPDGVHIDRRLIRRHVEAHAYEETVKRNSAVFTKGAPAIWFPKIVLQGLQYFTDLVLKLRDRGDIPLCRASYDGGDAA